MIDENWQQLEKNGGKNFIIWKNLDGNESSMKEKYLLRKFWTSMIVNFCLLLTQHDKWLLENGSKTPQNSHRGRHSPIKTLHSEKLLHFVIENNVLQSWNISASHGIVMQSQSQRYFVGLINKFRTWKLFTITFQACITFYTQTPWIIFLLIVWWIYTLRFT